MSKILDWIKKHVWQTVLIGFGLFFAPLILVHIAYRIPAVSPWFASTWESGELITYIAGFEAFIGTVSLGCATVYLNANANKLSSSLLNLEEKRSVFERQPVLQIKQESMEIITISELTEKIKTPIGILHFEKPAKDYLPFDHPDQSLLFLTFNVSNAVNNPIKFDLHSMSITKAHDDSNKTIEFLVMKNDNPSGIVQSGGSQIFSFAINRDDFFEDLIYTFTFKITLSNAIREEYNCELSFLYINLNERLQGFLMCECSITNIAKTS